MKYPRIKEENQMKESCQEIRIKGTIDTTLSTEGKKKVVAFEGNEFWQSQLCPSSEELDNTISEETE